MSIGMSSAPSMRVSVMLFGRRTSMRTKRSPAIDGFVLQREKLRKASRQTRVYCTCQVWIRAQKLLLRHHFVGSLPAVGARPANSFDNRGDSKYFVVIDLRRNLESR